MKRLALVFVLLLGACAQPVPPAQPSAPQCAVPLKWAVEVSLYFGRDKQGGGQVSEPEWSAFLADVVTPRFPDGSTVVETGGQYREPSGRITRERSKLVMLVVFEAASYRAKVDEIIETYKQRFLQRSVLRTERSVCAGL